MWSAPCSARQRSRGALCLRAVRSSPSTPNSRRALVQILSGHATSCSADAATIGTDAAADAPRPSACLRAVDGPCALSSPLHRNRRPSTAPAPPRRRRGQSLSFLCPNLRPARRRAHRAIMARRTRRSPSLCRWTGRGSSGRVRGWVCVCHAEHSEASNQRFGPPRKRRWIFTSLLVKPWARPEQ